MSTTGRRIGNSGAISVEIQLYAVSTRYPSKLFSGVSAEEIREGVWECLVLRPQHSDTGLKQAAAGTTQCHFGLFHF